MEAVLCSMRSIVRREHAGDGGEQLFEDVADAGEYAFVCGVLVGSAVVVIIVHRDLLGAQDELKAGRGGKPCSMAFAFRAADSCWLNFILPLLKGWMLSFWQMESASYMSKKKAWGSSNILAR